jgi:glutamyl-Q tRNA(Asp) synthetase
LLAAAASYLQARRHGGRWLVRIEDIDPPREQPGATERILEALERYGFEWDGPVTYQSRSGSAHEADLARLLEAGQAYPCGCSRADLVDAPRGPLGTIYPGTCRTGCSASETVVDDYKQGVTEIVRGIDLIDSTCRQIWLQGLLAYPTPDYSHIPVAAHADGDKLSKLTGAKGVPLGQPEKILVQALSALGQRPPAGLGEASLQDIWSWAVDHWHIEALTGRTRILVDSNAMAEGKNGLL